MMTEMASWYESRHRELVYRALDAEPGGRETMQSAFIWLEAAWVRMVAEVARGLSRLP